MSRRYLEVLNYQYSVKYYVFYDAGRDFRNKVLKDRIDVSIVLDLKWVGNSNEF